MSNGTLGATHLTRLPTKTLFTSGNNDYMEHTMSLCLQSGKIAYGREVIRRCLTEKQSRFGSIGLDVARKLRAEFIVSPYHAFCRF